MKTVHLTGQLAPFTTNRNWELWGYWGYIWDDENGNPQTINQLGESLYGDPTKNYNIGYYNLEVEETAFFGEISYTFTIGEHELELLAGIRFYDFEDSESYTESGIWVGEEAGDSDTSGGSDGDTQKYSVSWRPSEDMSIYALYSEGYRPGGVGLPSLPQSCRDDPYAQYFSPRYDPDTIENYELGFKALLLDRRLSITSAIYQIDWTDVQTDIYMATCGFAFYANAAEAQSQGFEFESTYLIQDDLLFIFNYGYTNSELTEDAPFLDASKGDDMTMVPKYNAYVALDKEFQVYGKDASVRLSMSAYDGYRSHFRALEEDETDAYERWDLMGSISPSDNIRMSLHIDNLLDEEIITYKKSRLSNPDYGLEQYVYYAPERTLTLRVDFSY
jgi:outer membrane receptor protein involved in Fe transport